MAIFSIGKAWDDSRPIIARDGRLMFIIALATVVLPQTLIALVAPEASQTTINGVSVAQTEMTGGMALLTLIGSLLNIIGSIAISYLALTRGASVADGLRRGVKRLLPTIGVFLLFALIAVMVIAVVIVVVAGVSLAELEDPTQIEALSPLAALAIIAMFFLFVWAAVRFLLITPVIAAEDVGPIGIIKRSWGLTRGNFWRLLGFLILFVIGVLIVMAAVGILFGLAIALAFGEPEPMSLSALFSGLVSGLVGAAVTVVYSTIVARIYLQLAGKPADPDAETLRTTVPPTA